MSAASIVAWAAGLAALAALASILLLAFVESTRLIRPADYRHPREAGFRYPDDPQTAHGIPFEEVAFAAPAGGQIRGWLVPGAPGSRRALLAVHGRAADRRAFLPLVPAMHRAGAAMLLIDLRENGTSDGAGRGTGLGMREADDIDTAVAGLKARGFETVAVAGCSLGGSAALIAAARNPQIDAVVADSAMTSMKAFVADLARRRLRSAARWVPEGAIGAWSDLVIWISRLRAGVPGTVDAVGAVGEIAPRPLLLIHGMRDEAVNSWHAEALLAGARAPDALWRVPDAGHCGVLGAENEAYAARVVALLEAAASREQAQADTSVPERSQ